MSFVFPTVFQAPALFTSMSSLFCVTCARNRFLQRGKLTDVIEDDGCKTCNLGNKKKRKDVSSLFKVADGWKGKTLGTQSKSSKHGQEPTLGTCSNGLRY